MLFFVAINGWSESVTFIVDFSDLYGIFIIYYRNIIRDIVVQHLKLPRCSL